jgi:hypothetical protein
MDWEKAYTQWKKKAVTIPMLMRNVRDVDKKEELTVAIVDNMQSGSYCKVFPECYDNSSDRFAIKISKRSRKLDDIQLFSEYMIHQKLYSAYVSSGEAPKIVKPLWLRMVRFNGGPPVLGFAMECFDETLFQYLERHRGDTENSRRWKQEILAELRKTHKAWGFYHRDLHTANVGVVNDNWVLFDFGMSLIGEYQPHNGNSVGFYDNGEVPSARHDERVLRFSWSQTGDKDSEYVAEEKKKIATSDVSTWKKNMPVVIANHPRAKSGMYLWEEANNTLLVEMYIKNLKRKRHSNHSTLCCSFTKKDIQPDLSHEHICYFVPTLK